MMFFQKQVQEIRTLVSMPALCEFEIGYVPSLTLSVTLNNLHPY